MPAPSVDETALELILPPTLSDRARFWNVEVQLLYEAHVQHIDVSISSVKPC